MGVNTKGNTFFINLFYGISSIYYVKLQEAYASESNKMGGWKMIGYQAPGSATDGTTNFSYTGSITTDAATTEAATDAWAATSKVALNDCPNGSKWNINTTIASATGVVSFTAQVASACAPLTPSFTQISH